MKLNAKSMAQIGMLSAIAGVLMLFEMPLWFAPFFYQMDISEVPVLIGGFALGPIAAILIELIKNLLKLVISSTKTGGVGEISNFIIGCSFVVPSAIYYHRNKTKKGAFVSLIIGTISLTVVGSILNAYILLPVYSKAYGISLENLILKGTEVNSGITDLKTFIMLAVAPFNLLKGLIASFITFVLYKHISTVLR
ncbi:MAG TPA: ECF transporter S component [Clostridiales bacterium]|nr:ECF transporter S component [Clostridiales bacterium]